MSQFFYELLALLVYKVGFVDLYHNFKTYCFLQRIRIIIRIRSTEFTELYKNEHPKISTCFE